MPQSMRPRRRAWSKVPVELLALVVAVATSLVPLMGDLDRALFVQFLAVPGQGLAATGVASVSITAAEARQDSCASGAVEVFAKGRARAVLVSATLAEVCQGLLLPSLSDSELAPPFGTLPLTGFLTSERRVVGFREPGPILFSLGIKEGYLGILSEAAVPQVNFARLASGTVESHGLDNRVVIFSLDSEQQSLHPSPTAIAAGVASGLDGRWVHWPNHWLRALAALLGALLALQLVRIDSRPLRWTAFLLCLLPLNAALVAVGVLSGWGVPGVSLLAAMCLAYGVGRFPHLAAAKRADTRAFRLLEKAARLTRTQPTHALEDADFWQRLARRASLAHPADDVLVAELPPFGWRLKVWPNGDLDDSIIKERRRDVRRTPWANEQGVPSAGIARDFLVMKDVPAVLVPLIDEDDVEGYLVLVGDSAAQHFAKKPETARLLSKELGRLVRRRRVAVQRENDWRHAAGWEVKTRVGRAESLLVDARAAFNELELFGTLLRHSPAGILYADSFGDVRLVSSAFAQWLPEMGVELPPQEMSGALAPNGLSMSRVIEAFVAKAGRAVPSLAELSGKEWSVDVPMPLNLGQAGFLRLTVVRLKESDKEEASFVAGLTEHLGRADSMPPDSASPITLPGGVSIPSSYNPPSIRPLRGDPLQVFSLAKVLGQTVHQATLNAGNAVKLHTPRELATVIGHKQELRDALLEFLVNAARSAGQSPGPVLALVERRLQVELRIMDLRLGVPSAVLKRVLVAASEPPKGLEPFAALVEAVENCHGSVFQEEADGWGVVLKLRMLRARPRLDESGPTIITTDTGVVGTRRRRRSRYPKKISG